MNWRPDKRNDASIGSVILGSRMDLHPGIHESLRSSPPAGCRYITKNGEHVFVHSHGRGGFSPVRRNHWAELVSFGAGSKLVHSVSWPVLGRRHWVVELDDFGYPAFAGRRILSASFRCSLQQGWTEAFTRNMRTRTECLVRAYTHESCGAVIFMTLAAARSACDALVELQLERWIEPLMKKAVVIYPATQALPAEEIARKWDRQRRLKVLFCGRAFRAKDGELALTVVRRLFERGHHFEFTYVGHIPAWAHDRFRDVLAQIRVFESLPRRNVLALMKDAHVLFHPSPNESVGMVFLEAAAAGLAVIASEGPGLPQLSELFPSAGVRSVNRVSGNQTEHERRFEAALEACLRSWARTRAIGFRNHRRARDGAISVLQRNEALASIYESTLRRQGTKPLHVTDLVAERNWTSTRIGARRLLNIVSDGWSRPTEPYFTLHPGAAWPSSRQHAGE